MRNRETERQKGEVRMTRKEALKKVGVTALTASTLIFMQTKAYASGSDTEGNPGAPGAGRRSR